MLEERLLEALAVLALLLADDATLPLSSSLSATCMTASASRKSVDQGHPRSTPAWKDDEAAGEDMLRREEIEGGEASVGKLWLRVERIVKTSPPDGFERMTNEDASGEGRASGARGLTVQRQEHFGSIMRVG